MGKIFDFNSQNSDLKTISTVFVHVCTVKKKWEFLHFLFFFLFLQVKMLSLIDLSSVISPSSLPSSLKSPLNPHSPPSSSSASSSSPNHVTSRNKSPPKSNPPVAPPPRMDKPMKKQSSEPTIPLQGGKNDSLYYYQQIWRLLPLCSEWVFGLFVVALFISAFWIHWVQDIHCNISV